MRGKCRLLNELCEENWLNIKKTTNQYNKWTSTHSKMIQTQIPKHHPLKMKKNVKNDKLQHYLILIFRIDFWGRILDDRKVEKLVTEFPHTLVFTIVNH